MRGKISAVAQGSLNGDITVGCQSICKPVPSPAISQKQGFLLVLDNEVGLNLANFLGNDSQGQYQLPCHSHK